MQPTKQLTNQRDLALAYSPGVAAACDEIVRDPAEARNLTSRGNLIGVVTNGTAVLGLGAIGPLAAKPVMEGKAVLFKKFAGIDCFDIEIDERDPDRLVEIIASLEPTFGGINLEDIKAPECFYVEKKLRERMQIPVFHDDQHGTAIVVGAAILNGLDVVGKRLDEVKVVCSGAGAAALACLDLLVSLGIPQRNIWVADIAGVVHAGRTVEMDDNKARYMQPTDARTLADLLPGADVFLGLSAAKVLQPEWLARMAARPLILALANPEPEIMPDLAKAARPDAIIATGRSDYPNQVNNVLVFPFIFRGALDVAAQRINEPMKVAAVRALADLAKAEQSDIVAQAYGIHNLRFGPEYLIPKPFDPRLIVTIAPAVAQAAMESGVAGRPIADFAAYRERLTQFVYHSGLLMKPVFQAAKKAPKRIVYAEGEDERVLRAVQVVLDEGLARADPDRSPGGAREAHRAVRAADPSRRGRRGDQPGVRSALPRVLVRVLPADAAQGDIAVLRQDRDAPPAHADRGDGDPSRRCRRHALRHLRHPQPAPAVRRPGAGLAPGREELRGDERGAAAGAHGVRRRHLRERRSDGRRNRRDHAAGRRRSCAASGSRPRSRCCRTRRSAAATIRRRRRCSRRCCASTRSRPSSRSKGEMHGDAALSEEVRLAAFPELAPEGRGEPADHADHRRGQHLVQPAQGVGRRQRDARPDPARRVAAGAHPHAVGDRAPDRQHDGADHVDAQFEQEQRFKV